MKKLRTFFKWLKTLFLYLLFSPIWFPIVAYMLTLEWIQVKRQFKEEKAGLIKYIWREIDPFSPLMIVLKSEDKK